jgi:NADH dehydrogenase
VAPAAKQMGACAADNIQARIAGRATDAFRYRDWGALATIGRHSAVAQLPNLRFSGFFAWWFWLLLHIYFLIGFRSRLIVLINWAWAYFTYERGARIILGVPHERGQESDNHGSEEKVSAEENRRQRQARSEAGA